MTTRSAAQPSDHGESFAWDPFPVRERVRHHAPLFPDPVDGVYLLRRYEDVAAVLRDDTLRLFHDRRPGSAGEVPHPRLHPYHLTVPSLRATITKGGSR